MKVRFLPEAKQEYKEAARFYRRIDSTLGRQFIVRVEEGVATISRNPLTFRIVELDVRRHLIVQFPYGLYYSREEEIITVHAVMHLLRKPDSWKERRL